MSLTMMTLSFTRTINTRRGLYGSYSEGRSIGLCMMLRWLLLGINILRNGPMHPAASALRSFLPLSTWNVIRL